MSVSVKLELVELYTRVPCSWLVGGVLILLLITVLVELPLVQFRLKELVVCELRNRKNLIILVKY